MTNLSLLAKTNDIEDAAAAAVCLWRRRLLFDLSGQTGASIIRLAVLARIDRNRLRRKSGFFVMHTVDKG